MYAVFVWCVRLILSFPLYSFTCTQYLEQLSINFHFSPVSDFQFGNKPSCKEVSNTTLQAALHTEVSHQAQSRRAAKENRSASTSTSLKGDRETRGAPEPPPLQKKKKEDVSCYSKRPSRSGRNAPCSATGCGDNKGSRAPDPSGKGRAPKRKSLIVSKKSTGICRTFSKSAPRFAGKGAAKTTRTPGKPSRAAVNSAARRKRKSVAERKVGNHRYSKHYLIISHANWVN